MNVGETRTIYPNYQLTQSYEWGWVERRFQSVGINSGTAVTVDSFENTLPGSSSIYSYGSAVISGASPGIAELTVRGEGGDNTGGSCGCSSACCSDDIDNTFNCSAIWTVVIQEQEANAWWQAENGGVFAGLETGTALRSDIPDVCGTTSGCTPALLTEDAVGTANSDGFAVTGGGSISVNGYYNERTPNPEAIGTALTRVQPGYDYFYNLLELPLEPEDDFAGQKLDAGLPDLNAQGEDVFFSNGDLSIQNRWQVPSGERVVVVVDGNLTLADAAGVENLVDVADGGFLLFVVSGDVVVESSVGNAADTDDTANLEGLYVADGQIVVQSTANTTTEERFVGEGSFVGWQGFNLQRDLSNQRQDAIPTTLFRYRPDLLLNAPAYLEEPAQTWQEVQ
jgi:hypothetical protein